LLAVEGLKRSQYAFYHSNVISTLKLTLSDIISLGICPFAMVMRDIPNCCYFLADNRNDNQDTNTHHPVGIGNKGIIYLTPKT